MVEFKYEIVGNTEKTKLNVYEDGNGEEFLKMFKEFQNYEKKKDVPREMDGNL